MNKWNLIKSHKSTTHIRISSPHRKISWLDATEWPKHPLPSNSYFSQITPKPNFRVLSKLMKKRNFTKSHKSTTHHLISSPQRKISDLDATELPKRPLSTISKFCQIPPISNIGISATSSHLNFKSCHVDGQSSPYTLSTHELPETTFTQWAPNSLLSSFWTFAELPFHQLVILSTILSSIKWSGRTCRRGRQKWASTPSCLQCIPRRRYPPQSLIGWNFRTVRNALLLPPKGLNLS